MYHFCNCFSWVLAFRQYLIASTISYWNPSVCPWAYQTRLYLRGFSRSTAPWGLGRLPPLYHAEASSVTPHLPQLWSSCYHRAQSQSRPSNKPRAFSLEHIHIKWDCFSIKKKKKRHIEVKFPPLQSMERVAHTASKPFKSFSLSWFGLLSSQEMLLPPPAQRTPVLFKFRESSHYSGWKQSNVTLWVHQLRESLGMRTKAQGKNKYIKGIVTLRSTEKDLRTGS